MSEPVYICDRCGERAEGDQLAPAMFDLAAVNNLRATMRKLHPERSSPPLTEYEPERQHWAWVWRMGRRERVRCGPLREATEWDEWLWRIGAVRA